MIRSYADRLRTILLGAALSCALGFPAQAISQLAISTDLTTTVRGSTVADDDAVQLDGSAPADRRSLGLPFAADINALHVIDDSTLLFSLKSSLSLTSGYGTPGDILQWASGTVTVFASRTDLGLASGTAVDAVSFHDGKLIFSVNISDSINGVVVTDSDLMQWTEADSTSLFLAESQCAIPQAADVSAAHVLNSENVLFVFSTNTTIGGADFKSSDVVRCNLTTNSVALYERILDETGQQPAADIDALAVFRGQTVFRNDFERP